MKIVCFASVLLTAWACGSQGKPVDMDSDFTLKVGESASIAAADVTVTFREVVEDSRCPSQVTCVWAGQAQVILGVVEPDVQRELTFQIRGGKGEQKLRGGLNEANLYLMKLDPYPETGDHPIAPGDYVVTLRLTSEKSNEGAPKKP